MKRPTRERVYRLACLGYSPTRIRRTIKKSKSTIQYHLDTLVSEGSLRRKGKGHPGIYTGTRMGVRKGDHGDGGEVRKGASTRSHHSSRKFEATGPPMRIDAIEWSNDWIPCGTHIYVLTDKSVDTAEGPIVCKEVRVSVGHSAWSIQVRPAAAYLTSNGELEVYEAEVTDKGILVATAIARTIKMPTIILPHPNQESHHAIRKVWIDNSEGALELETKDTDIAMVLTDPRALIREEATRLLIDEGLIPLTDTDKDGKT